VSALSEWYDYDFATHVLSVRPTVYVVRSLEGDACSRRLHCGGVC